MKLKNIKETLEAKILVETDNWEDLEVIAGCASDLMSDILSFVQSGCLLLTGLTNPQVIRTAEMADLKAICFVRGKTPSDETIELARNENIPVLSTEFPIFESCGKLYANGLSGISEAIK